MSISSQISDYYRNEYHSGKKQVELAEKHHVSHVVVQGILSGRRKASGFRIATVEKMFPNAVIDLFGDGNVHQEGNTGTVVGINHGNVSIPEKDFKERAMSGVLAMDISAEDKVKVLQFLKDL